MGKALLLAWILGVCGCVTQPDLREELIDVYFEGDQIPTWQVFGEHLGIWHGLDRVELFEEKKLVASDFGVSQPSIDWLSGQMKETRATLEQGPLFFGLDEVSVNLLFKSRVLGELFGRFQNYLEVNESRGVANQLEARMKEGYVAGATYLQSDLARFHLAEVHFQREVLAARQTSTRRETE